MAPIGTPHLIVVTRLQRWFEKGLAEDSRVLVQQPLIGDRFNEPQPDAVILREPLGNRKPVARDCPVVIEVSDTSYHEDRYIKLPAYLRDGVRLVWIVNIRQGSSRCTTVCPRPTSGAARTTRRARKGPRWQTSASMSARSSRICRSMTLAEKV